jgi:hypothetical protein
VEIVTNENSFRINSKKNDTQLAAEGGKVR